MKEEIELGRKRKFASDKGGRGKTMGEGIGDFKKKGKPGGRKANSQGVVIKAEGGETRGMEREGGRSAGETYEKTG